jgi:cobalamin synthase
MGFKDPNQGAAAIVFLIIFTLLSSANLYALFTRRPAEEVHLPLVVLPSSVSVALATLPLSDGRWCFIPVLIGLAYPLRWYSQQKVPSLRFTCTTLN